MNRAAFKVFIDGKTLGISINGQRYILSPWEAEGIGRGLIKRAQEVREKRKEKQNEKV